MEAHRIERRADAAARECGTSRAAGAARLAGWICPALLVGACGAEDRTHIVYADALAAQPPLGGTPPSSVVEPEFGLRDAGVPFGPGVPGVPPVRRAPRPGGAGVTDCAPSAERALRVLWSEPYQDPGCTFLSSPRVDTLPPGIAFELGPSGRLTLAPGRELELVLGAATFRWHEGAFRRELECDAPPSTTSGAGAWRFVESLHGTWIGDGPFEACSDEPLRFVGSYQYRECEVQVDRSCVQGPAHSNCSAFSVVELEVMPLGVESVAAPPEAAAAACRPVPELCGGGECARLGEACTQNAECEVGSFCDLPDCAGPGTCASVPSLDECYAGELSDVCGCDGRSYSSLCLAHYRAVSARDGACVPPAD